jgi:DNA-3-methyladenine glycosylase II
LNFEYGQEEIDYLKKKDKILGEAIDQIGHILREVDVDLFSSVIHHIIGQQISTKAQGTVWNRIQCLLGKVSPEAVCELSVKEMQGLGMTYKKAEYILDFSCKVHSGEFDIEALKYMDDSSAVKSLSSLRGIGEWTAEMILLFSLERPDILSYGDLAIHRGLRMLYHHRNVRKELFEKYKRRYAPYGSVASLYLWAIAGGSIDGMRDYAPKKK